MNARLAWGTVAALTVALVWLYYDRAHLEETLAVISANETFTREQRSLALADAQRVKTALATTESRLTQLTAEMRTLKERQALAQIQIATLHSKADEYSMGVAVVVWDSVRHEGVLKLERMPLLTADKDYQVWVVDPAKSKPVSAGIVALDAKGFATLDFKPVVDVTAASQFALSVESKGGVPESQGPFVFIGP